MQKICLNDGGGVWLFDLRTTYCANLKPEFWAGWGVGYRPLIPINSGGDGFVHRAEYFGDDDQLYPYHCGFVVFAHRIGNANRTAQYGDSGIGGIFDFFCDGTDLHQNL